MDAKDKTLETLQALVDGFAMDVGRVRAALADNKTSPPVQQSLVGALNYVLDAWDIFPDHYRGLGVVDDALVLRVAAHLAVAEGCQHRGLQSLAGEMKIVRALLEDLVEPLKALCQALPGREVKGRKAADILADADVRALFEADLNRLLKKHQPGPIDVPPGGSAALLSELRKMARSALGK